MACSKILIFFKTKKYLLKLRKRLHVLSILRAKQSTVNAKPTIHIAYTMKIGHTFEVSIVEVESSSTALSKQKMRP
jgi:hypothetical protein